jgi:hypothetical protein
VPSVGQRFFGVGIQGGAESGALGRRKSNFILADLERPNLDTFRTLKNAFAIFKILDFFEKSSAKCRPMIFFYIFGFKLELLHHPQHIYKPKQLELFTQQ